MNGTDWLNLPDSWGALWPIIKNPAIAGIVISIAMEQLKWIQNKDVPNIKKLGAVFLACVGWAIFIVLGSPDANVTLANLKAVLYTIVIMAVGVTTMSQIGYGLIQSIPWLKDILEALFGNTTIKSAKVITVQQAQTGIANTAISYGYGEVNVNPSDSKQASDQVIASVLDEWTGEQSVAAIKPPIKPPEG